MNILTYEHIIPVGHFRDFPLIKRSKLFLDVQLSVSQQLKNRFIFCHFESHLVSFMNMAD